MQMKEITLNELKQRFQKTGDVKFQQFMFQHETVHIITCEGMVDDILLYELVLPELKKVLEDNEADNKDLENILKFQRHLEISLALPHLKKISKIEDCERQLFTGQCLIYFEIGQILFITNISNKPNRKPEETNIEVAVKGPRDNFIEDLSVNIALVRKRLPTNSLIVEKMQIGERSKTDVALLYFEDIADKELLQKIKNQLGNVKGDIILSGEVLIEDVSKKLSIFPKTDYTGRPDFVMQALVRGRFALLVDGTTYATLLPTNFFLLLKSPEDNEYPVVYSSFQRILRILGLLLALLLPSFWLALTTFHQDQIPVQLLATVVQANTGLPLPSALEMLIMIFFFELFREAGLRLPTVIGGTISVVGGLIIGDAAIRAGITSPAMVVVIAISTIAGFTLVNQSLVGSVTLLRIGFVILTSFLGLFGFFACIYFTIAYLSYIKVFGVPYLNIATDMSLNSLFKTIFRLKGDGYEKRPKMLNTKDDTRRVKK
ncbi:spore germination protein [Lysinibacillus sp. 3P01SB]|uniref:spore germination protein n=1 Tax=Lysinibacillus sp. 3P01SB TaxID=3132284 RepID=UPI0039A6226E